MARRPSCSEGKPQKIESPQSSKCRVAAHGVALLALTLTTHCDATFARILTLHALTPQSPLTPHSPVTPHCDDTFRDATFPPDSTFPGDAAF